MTSPFTVVASTLAEVISSRRTSPFTDSADMSPFAFFTYMKNVADVTTWRGSPWFFIGWQLALCATAVLVALLRGAEGRVRFRVTRTLQIVLVLAAILLVLASAGGFPHAVTA